VDPFYAGLIAVVVLLAAAGLFLFQREERKLRALFDRMAPSLNARVRPRFSNYSELVVPHRDISIRATGKPTGTSPGFGSHSGGGSRSESYATAVTPDGPRFTLVIQRRGGERVFHALVGGGPVAPGEITEVEIGSAGFREWFVVRSDDEDLARSVVTPAVERTLLALEEKSGETWLTYRESRVYGQEEPDEMFGVRKTTAADFRPRVTAAIAPFRVDETAYRRLLDVVREVLDALQSAD